ncbi:MAG: DAK2 domain-containing protein [SAR202 cluster bacterium]|nr:dihydroxyacetone kinase [Chloroflexota bacterium]MQG88092.1 DAK2 domain-containing protein [SAR202 cluster bacterium]|tara:strand:+ start:4328 stop:5992 length:1665 start_codon:yes stop_codon:yes gene_type:complete
MNKPETKISSKTSFRLTNMIRGAAMALDANRETINALNVFPVPDGDTGTNMLLSLRSVIEQLPDGTSESANEVAKIVARSALLGARGNSGLILAQYFKGLSEAIGEDTELTGEHFAKSIRHASDSAYKALPNPVEGTMLTVYRECAEISETAAAQNPDLESVMSIVAVEALKSVQRTPQLLPILAEAEVVDSGGFGFAVMIDGALRSLKGEDPIGRKIPVPMPNDSKFTGAIKTDFVNASEEIEWGYCTVFAIESENIDINKLRDQIAKIGRSAVVDGADGIAKVHVHMEDPGLALTMGLDYGQLSNIEIANMDTQASDWAADRREDTSSEDTNLLPVAVVAVAVGAGLKDLIISTGMGATSVLEGGDTMNPSVSDLLAAVEAAPSENVILLPNNKNIIPAALEVPTLTNKDVRVIQTLSIQTGVAALLEFNNTHDINENQKAMNSVLSEIGDGRVCIATRDANVYGNKIKKGMAFATFNEEIIAVGSEPFSVLTELIEAKGEDAEIITIYTGDSIEKDGIESTDKLLRNKFGDLEIEVIYGGQPHYDFLVAVE